MIQHSNNLDIFPLNLSIKLWGAWETIGFSLVTFVAFLSVQYIVMVIFIFNAPVEINNAYSKSLEYNGFFFSLAEIPAVLIALSLLILFAHIRCDMVKINLKQYFYLNPVSSKILLFWIAITAVLLGGIEIINFLLDRPIPESMIKMYETAGNYPLFLFAIIIAAPVFEEVFFRGFLFEGLRHSKLRAWGAILITATIWAIIHLQYDYFEIGIIFIIGIVLGIAKIKTNSLYTVILLHILFNLVAMIQLHYQMS